MTLDRKKWIDLVLGTLLIVLLKPLVMLAGRLLRRDHGRMPQGDILCVKMQGGGSLVIAYRALLGLRRAYPQHRLILLCMPATRSYGELLGVFDECVVVDDRSLTALAVSGLAALRACWRVDTVIDLEAYSRLTTVIGLFTLARNRISFYLESTFWRRNLSTHLLFLNRAAGVFVFYHQLARLLGAEPVAVEECRAALLAVVGGAERRLGERIGVAAFCSELGRERMLTTEQWRAKLLPAVQGRPVEIILFGASSDQAAAEALAEGLRACLPQATVINGCGAGSLKDSVRRIAGLEAFWSIDSGLLHFARVLGVPTRSFWGPTDPATRLEPFAGARDEAEYRKICCSPCIHVAETPPCRGDNRCIQALFHPAGDEAAEPIWPEPTWREPTWVVQEPRR